MIDSELNHNLDIGVKMQKEIRISVVIPVYNVEKYLHRCIDSIKQQTYENWEAILVDDGSTDRSNIICDEIAAEDNRFRVYHKKNEGLGLTRNYGIRKSSGDYVFFLDSDDYIEKTALSDLTKHITSYGCDLVIGNFYYQEEVVPIPIESKLYIGKEINDNIVLRIIGSRPGEVDQLTPSSCGKLYRKSIFFDKNVWFPSERVLIWEDLAFNYAYIRECEKVYLSDIPVYHYCFNGASLTHKYDPDKLEKVMKMYSYMRGQIETTQEDTAFMDRLNNNFIGHIRTCFKLEAYYDKQNGYKNTARKIKTMCQREDVARILNEYNPNYYNRAQKVFSYFLKKRMSILIYTLCKIQNIKKRIE